MGPNFETKLYQTAITLYCNFPLVYKKANENIFEDILEGTISYTSNQIVEINVHIK